MESVNTRTCSERENKYESAGSKGQEKVKEEERRQQWKKGNE
jgi:hypothetical protein